MEVMWSNTRKTYKWQRVVGGSIKKMKRDKEQGMDGTPLNYFKEEEKRQLQLCIQITHATKFQQEQELNKGSAKSITISISIIQ